MIPALVNGELVRATPGARGACPSCGDAVYARLPEHAIRHWAHIPLADGEERACDSAGGEMSEWHLEWQSESANLARIEVWGQDKARRADLVTPAGFVVEFQRSPISPEDAQSREKYWGKGMWVLDGTPREDNGDERVRLSRRPEQSATDPWRMFTWPRAHLLLIRSIWPCWIDLGEKTGLLQVDRIDGNRSPLVGWGWLVDHRWFIDEIINGHRYLYRSHKPISKKSSTPHHRNGQARTESEEDLTPEECARYPLNEPLAIPARITVESPDIRPPIPGICSAGREPCGEPARLYPGGWRCDTHKPITPNWSHG